jgi:hypothetical protein
MAYRRMTREQLLQRLAEIAPNNNPSSLIYSPVGANNSVAAPAASGEEAAAASFLGGGAAPRDTRPVEQWISPTGHTIQAVDTGDGWFDIIQDEAPRPSASAQRTPEQQRVDAANATKVETDNAQEAQLNNERSYNQAQGRGYVTHAEYARQQAEQERLQRERDAVTRQQAIDQRTVDQQAAANQLNQQQLQEQIRHNQQTEKDKPMLVGTPNDTTAQIGIFDPNTGAMQTIKNPAYDQVKAQAEQERQRIATEIAQRRMNLDEGIQQYTQWFDQNVKIPFMQSTEARDRAKEQRDALDAEERRRQFAADFSLRKGQLGQQAGAEAMRAEESLLPYRAGPTEAANMSDAINGLAAGGNPQGPSAAAGIHFSPTDFQFAAPDFKSIAKSAAKQALSGLTNYRPVEGSYQTADYSGINLPNAQTMASAPVISSGGRYAGPSASAPVNTPPPATDYDYSGPPPD